MKLLTYYHTIKYLKITQIFYRIYKRFFHPTPNKLAGRVAFASGAWVRHGLYEQKLFDGNRVRFLNVEGVVHSKSDWNDTSQSKLWLYNLHYFDDLSAINTAGRADQQIDFINKWIQENPAAEGNGWEPYPTSLRVVNWVKAFLSGISTKQVMLDSLAQQTDFLSQDLEHHLLGNHLFVNAKALIFAGLFLDGKDADRWLETGLGIYNRELGEQVLSDGGNFELTPMYHIIMLVDLLDLINIFTAYSNEIDSCVLNRAKSVALTMFDWLHSMSHSDGEISFFNDTAFGISPKNTIVVDYAKKLGLNVSLSGSPPQNALEVFDLQSTGYVSVRTIEYTLIADLSPIGPDYLPGHAHADTLSFEFSLGGQRVFVNSGISGYGLSEERLRQRKTAAHNTVSVNGLDSSYVWSGFRVAQRAQVKYRVVKPVIDDAVSMEANHDGFKRQGVNCIHHRKWHLTPKRMSFEDKLIGEYNTATGYLHLHPKVDVIEVKNEIAVLAIDHYTISVEVSGALVSLESTTWHPQFGMSYASKKLCFEFRGDAMTLDVSWQKNSEDSIH